MHTEKWFKTYIYIWIGQFLSLLTSSAVNFAVIIYLSLHYKSAEILAYAGIAGLLPQAIIGPFAGVYIDRWDRKKVMIYADAFIAFCTFLMSFAFVEGEANLGFVYMLLVCRSLGQAFHTPAMQAIAPLIVPEDKLLKVSGINQMLQSVSMIAGPAAGTLAITYLPISKVLYLDVIGASLAIVSLLFVVIPKLTTQQAESNISTVLHDLNSGFIEIQKNKGLYMLFIYAMLTTFFVMPVAIMYPLLTIDHFSGGKWEMSIIEIVWGVGMLVGGGILSIWQGSISKVILVNAMHIFLGLTFVFSGWISGDLFWIFVAITTFGGIGMSFFNASFMTIIQEEIKPEFLGRVFSLYFSFAIIPSVIGLLFTGWIADEIGVVNAFIIGGLAMCVVGLLSFLTPSVMNLGKNRLNKDNVESEIE
ncbi:MFS transporter [Sphingobacterium bovistauri]|uniref:MFS transporter n=1 Tax=Sphingobacterium bovistauri TaxID=2781959 RepID=A0ABS7Z215_9SPHI|nr:MFS transporter [Sphingobacterium bovistauri]MCA5004171.1 MFS transporter [Sphingobacterium bovistauri]